MSEITLTETAREVLGNVSLLLVPTDAGDESDRVRAAAVTLAREAGCSVVLHDRSDERWTDTPHPEGPYTIDEIDQDRAHLVGQMQVFVEAGIDVTAWYASVPALTAVLTPVQTLGADGILVPESIDNPKMMDRLQAGDDAGEMIGRLLDQNIERPIHIFVLGDDGTIEVITTIDRTDRPD
jgi:hypothetical protein